MKHFTKRIHTFCLLLALSAMLNTGCFSTSKTQRGAAIGGGMGATVGALIGKTAGNTALGTIIGGAIGGTAGAFIGHKMDQVSNLNQTILFGAGSDTLSADDSTSLKKLTVSLQSTPQAKVSITGYTDSLGTANYNMQLSIKRAMAVKACLVAAGVEDKIITTAGKGATEQIAPNTTQEGREKNRRVEVVVSLTKK